VISPYIPPGWDEWRALVTSEDFYNYTLNENGVHVNYGSSPAEYLTNVSTNQALNFIQSAPAGQPLFLYYAPIAPHHPYTPAPQDIGLFNGLAPFRPPSFNEADVSDKPDWIRALPLLDAAAIANQDAIRQMQLESLQSVDRGVNSILDALQAAGRLNNTIVIYTSDNGFMWGEHRIVEDKLCAYEEGSRVPLWISGPGIAGRSEAKFAQNVDLAPSIAQWAGVPLPSPVNGLSLANLIANPALPWRTEVLMESWGHFSNPTQKAQRGFFAVRDTRYVYVEYGNGNKELYDLLVDPFEMTNVVNNPAYAAEVARLSALLQILKNQ
jgi:arylsulfatase A-like enzyme